jgi:AraC-like DNA-binding protein
MVVARRPADTLDEDPCPWQVRSLALDLAAWLRVGTSEVLVPPEVELGGHAHGPAILSLVLCGGFEERYERTQRVGSPASVVAYAPDALHSGSFVDAPTRLFSVALPGHVLARAGVAQLADAGALQTTGIVRSMFDLREASRPDGGARRADLDAALRRLLSALARAELSRPEARARVAPVAELLRDHHYDPPRVSELAERLSVHPVHLTRLFRRAHGCTIPAYVRHLRVSRAIRLLCDTATPLARIAHAVGFADQSHFGRAFKRVTGSSPGRYRRALSGRS